MNAPLSPAVLTTQHSPASYRNFGSMGCYSNNPTRDAADHYDALADDEASEVEVDIEYCGIKLVATVSRNKQQLCDVVLASNGEDMMSEFSDYALANIYKKAIALALKDARCSAW